MLTPEGIRYLGEHTADRGIEDYTELLGFEIRPGQRILDVGASAGTFAREVNRDFDGQAVVDSLDTFSNEDAQAGKIEFHGSSGVVEYWPNNRLQGDITRGTSLGAESYDYVVSLYAIPTWLSSYESAVSSVVEMARLCRVNGEVRLFPMWVDNKGNYDGFGSEKMLANVKNVFLKHGYSFQVEDVKEKDGRVIEDAKRIVLKKMTADVPRIEEFEMLSGLQRLVEIMKRLVGRRGYLIS